MVAWAKLGSHPLTLHSLCWPCWAYPLGISVNRDCTELSPLKEPLVERKEKQPPVCNFPNIKVYINSDGLMIVLIQLKQIRMWASHPSPVPGEWNSKGLSFSFQDSYFPARSLGWSCWLFLLTLFYCCFSLLCHHFCHALSVCWCHLWIKK